MDKLVVGTVVEIVKRVERWGDGTSWPKVDYELVGMIGVVKKDNDQEIIKYGYNLVLNNEKGSTYWFPRESLEIHENQNILLLRVNMVSPFHIMNLNTGKFILDETRQILKFKSKEETTNYIYQHYDQVNY